MLPESLKNVSKTLTYKTEPKKLTPAQQKALDKKRQWNLWYTLPLAPYNIRPTVFKEAVKGKVYMLEQSQGTTSILPCERFIRCLVRMFVC